MNLSDLAGFMKLIGELPAIAEQADKQRLGVILDDLIKEHPQLWEECVFCSKMDSPRTVLNYLTAKSVYFGFLRNIPNVETIIQFLMDFIKERQSNANNSISDSDKPWADGRYIARESTAPARRSARRANAKS